MSQTDPRASRYLVVELTLGKSTGGCTYLSEFGPHFIPSTDARAPQLHEPRISAATGRITVFSPHLDAH